MAVITKLTMAHEVDPKEVIRADVGDISEVKVLHNQVVVGIYERPEKTKGGIILTSNTKKEDLYQGVVGLVLALGPGAFVDDAVNKFYGMRADPGDWVVFRPSDGWKTSLNGKSVRLLEDGHVKLIVKHPDQAF